MKNDWILAWPHALATCLGHLPCVDLQKEHRMTSLVSTYDRRSMCLRGNDYPLRRDELHAMREGHRKRALSDAVLDRLETYFVMPKQPGPIVFVLCLSILYLSSRSSDNINCYLY